jgi:DNA-directed RNA polymerase specialized sigma24 family protein
MVPVKHIGENNDSSDESLLKAYQASGDQAHLAALYMRYTDLVFGVCLKYLKERENAKDAVMSIYQELIKKLQTHNVDNFKSWLYVVAKNHCLMQLRKEKKQWWWNSSLSLCNRKISHIWMMYWKKKKNFRNLVNALPH